MTAPLHWTRRPAREFANVASTWQQLCDSCVASPLLASSFVATSLDYFGTGAQWVCVGDDGQAPVAAAIVEPANAAAWHSFQPSQLPLGLWLQRPGMSFDTVARSLLRALPGWPMMLGATHLDPMHLARPAGATSLSIDALVTGEIDLPEERETFTRSIQSKPFDRRMRKAEREVGPLTLDVAVDEGSVQAYVDAYAAMECRGWKGALATALEPGNLQARFYADLLRRFAAAGQARLFTLRMGDRVAAAQIALADGNTLYLLKTTYDSELRSLGPGVLLHYFVSLSCYEAPARIRRIEYYGPLNESQRMWVTGQRTIYHANVYRFGALASMHRRWIDHRARQSRERSEDGAGATASADL